MGRAIADHYANSKSITAITGRREPLLNEFRNKFGSIAHTSCFDVTAENAISKIEDLVNEMGGLDLILISAGGGEISDSLEWEIDKRTIDTNVTAFAKIANWAYNYFSQQGHGHITAISSIAAIRGNSKAASYSASKAFQSNYLEGLAIKASRQHKNIRITCIEPGFVNTGMAKGDKMFWIVPLDKAANQIVRAIERKRRKVYISKRWRFIALLLRWVPFRIYKRFV